VQQFEDWRRLAYAFNTRGGKRAFKEPTQTRRPKFQRKRRSQTKRRNRVLARDINLGIGLAAGKGRVSKATIAGVGVEAIDGRTPNAELIARDIVQAGARRYEAELDGQAEEMVRLHQRRQKRRHEVKDCAGALESTMTLLDLAGCGLPKPRRGRPPKTPEQRELDAYQREMDRLLVNAQREMDEGAAWRDREQAALHGAPRDQAPEVEPVTEAERQLRRRGSMHRK
jgi:hypothetical protein